MNRKIILTSALAVFLVLAVQGGGRAAPPDGPPPPMKWWRVQEFVDQMGLTQEEKQKLDAMYIESHTKLIDAEAARSKAKLIMDDLLDKDELDEKAVFDQLERVNRAMATINTERFRFLIEIRRFLGAKRFARLKGIFDQHRMRIMKEKLEGRPTALPED